MIPMRKVSAAALIAALVAVSAAQAATTATMVQGTKTDLIPVASLADMVGSWTPGDVNFLEKAKSVKVYDARSLYPSADQTRISTAQASKSMQLGKFHDAIRADGSLKAWFDQNKIDINRVVAVADPNGQPEIFLY